MFWGLVESRRSACRKDTRRRNGEQSRRHLTHDVPVRGDRCQPARRLDGFRGSGKSRFLTGSGVQARARVGFHCPGERRRIRGSFSRGARSAATRTLMAPRSTMTVPRVLLGVKTRRRRDGRGPCHTRPAQSKRHHDQSSETETKRPIRCLLMRCCHASGPDIAGHGCSMRQRDHILGCKPPTVEAADTMIHHGIPRSHGLRGASRGKRGERSSRARSW